MSASALIPVDRRHHGEIAFAEWLAREAPNCRLEPAPTPSRDGSPHRPKRHDGMIRAADGTIHLIEIKTRRLEPDRPARRPRLQTWVTRADLAGLLHEETRRRASGQRVHAWLVFLYWSRLQPPDGRFEGVILSAGRWYGLIAYTRQSWADHAVLRSQRWDTVHLRRSAIHRVAGPLPWGRAACSAGSTALCFSP